MYATILALLFQYGVALHGVDLDGIAAGGEARRDAVRGLGPIGRKLGAQSLKDYVLFPVLTGPSAVLTLAANATANLARNVWAFTIIFCGHFPDGVATFTEEEAEGETRGGWYLRQLLGSANSAVKVKVRRKFLASPTCTRQRVFSLSRARMVARSSSLREGRESTPGVSSSVTSRSKRALARVTSTVVPG